MARWFVAALFFVPSLALSQVKECIHQFNPQTKTITEQCNSHEVILKLKKDERAALLSGRASSCRITKTGSTIRRECQ